jgi:YidC/Oxa1 family membrane protein insertase
MDTRNRVIGILLFAAAFGVLIFANRFAPKRPQPEEIRNEVRKQEATANVAAAPVAQAPAPGAPNPTSEEPMFTTAEADKKGSAIDTLGNGFVEVNFTEAGGAIRDVALKKYPAALGRPDPFIFNELHASPMMAFVGLPGLDRDTRYKLVSKSGSEIVYRAVIAGKMEVTRRYIVSPDKVGTTDPYLIRCETILRNLADTPSTPMRVVVSIGTAAPNNALDTGQQLMTEHSNGKDQVKTLRSALEASGGIMGFGAHEAKAEVVGAGPIEWDSVKNQFFAAILSPDEPAAGVETRRIKLLTELPDTDKRAYGIAGAVDFDLPSMPAHSQQTIAGNLYVGPKEYPRLSNSDVFRHDEDRVMDFGISIIRLCAGILITLMNWIHGWVHSWGVAIVLTTLSLKVVFIPITLAQSRTARRTQKAAPELAAIKEKHKDNPQKLQAATMELYKKHKINPVAGCVPMLLTLPFFWAFFTLLRSAAELRFEPFLWAHDLSAPDTIAVMSLPIIGALNLNVFPVLLGVVNYFQTRVMPQPSVDNAQMKLMKFMPVMFVVLYYNWACALSVYSMVNGLFTIGQQLMVNQTKDIEDTKAPGGRRVKNVTPRKA